MKWFKEQGWEVHVAANGMLDLPYVDQKYTIPIQRTPFRLRNIHAYKALKTIIDKNNYSIIHCHTPMGGVITRLAARKARKHGTKVLYTAHGFHFYQGAPRMNWIIYYPIEKALAHYTDCLLTINQEDYALAMEHRFKVNHIKRIHGVGVDIERFTPITVLRKRQLRMQHGYKLSDFLMFYAAEFNKNKNQQLLIQSLALVKHELPNARLLLAGDGPLIDSCKRLAMRLKVTDMVHFLGYRKDVSMLIPMCDVAVASSSREGLPVNIMEAMACGLSVIATDNRGHRELVCHGESGWLLAGESAEELSDKIKILSNNRELNAMFGRAGRKRIENKYALNKTLEEQSNIYTMFIEEEKNIDVCVENTTRCRKYESWWH